MEIQSSGLIIRRSAKSSRCYRGGVASWSPDALVENSSALAAPLKRLCWESIVEYKSFTAVLNYTLYCSAQKKLLQFFFSLSCISLLKWSNDMAVPRTSCVQEAASQRGVCINGVFKLESKSLKIPRLPFISFKALKTHLGCWYPNKGKLCMLQPGPMSVNKDGAAKWREKSLW